MAMVKIRHMSVDQKQNRIELLRGPGAMRLPGVCVFWVQEE